MPCMSRVIATLAVLLTYVMAAALDDRPQMMFVGLWPLTHVAAETVWHALGDFLGENT